MALAIQLIFHALPFSLGKDVITGTAITLAYPKPVRNKQLTVCAQQWKTKVLSKHGGFHSNN